MCIIFSEFSFIIFFFFCLFCFTIPLILPIFFALPVDLSLRVQLSLNFYLLLLRFYCLQLDSSLEPIFVCFSLFLFFVEFLCMLLCSLIKSCLGVSFNLLNLLQKSVFLFQNFFDVFAKERGIALSECLYSRHGFSVHLLFMLACFWISIYAIVYEAELPICWLEIEVCNEVLGILRDSAVF